MVVYGFTKDSSGTYKLLIWDPMYVYISQAPIVPGVNPLLGGFCEESFDVVEQSWAWLYVVEKKIALKFNQPG